MENFISQKKEKEHATREINNWREGEKKVKKDTAGKYNIKNKQW